jgi:hypothetical protein
LLGNISWLKGFFLVFLIGKKKPRVACANGAFTLLKQFNLAIYGGKYA